MQKRNYDCVLEDLEITVASEDINDTDFINNCTYCDRPTRKELQYFCNDMKMMLVYPEAFSTPLYKCSECDGTKYYFINKFTGDMI